MPKPEWGAKHICHSCGTRYYDLQRDPIVCPKCNTQFDPEAFLKSRRTRSAAVEEVAPPKPVAVKAAVTEEADVAAEEPEEVAEVELEADEESAGLKALEVEEESSDTASDEPDLGADVDEAEDEDEDSDVLLEDASELGDDDVDEVVDISDDDDPNA